MINSLETRKEMCSLTCIFICTCLQHAIVRKANPQRLNLDGFQLIRPYGARKDFHSTVDKTPRRPPRRIDRGTTEMNFHSPIGRCFVWKRRHRRPIDVHRRVRDIPKAAFSLHLTVYHVTFTFGCSHAVTSNIVSYTAYIPARTHCFQRTALHMSVKLKPMHLGIRTAQSLVQLTAHDID